MDTSYVQHARLPRTHSAVSRRRHGVRRRPRPPRPFSRQPRLGAAVVPALVRTLQHGSSVRAAWAYARARRAYTLMHDIACAHVFESKMRFFSRHISNPIQRARTILGAPSEWPSYVPRLTCLWAGPFQLTLGRGVWPQRGEGSPRGRPGYPFLTAAAGPGYLWSALQRRRNLSSPAFRGESSSPRMRAIMPQRRSRAAGRGGGASSPRNPLESTGLSSMKGGRRGGRRGGRPCSFTACPIKPSPTTSCCRC